MTGDFEYVHSFLLRCILVKNLTDKARVLGTTLDTAEFRLVL
jgi:hypothetical protein